MFRASHDQVAMLPDEVRLLLLGFPPAFAVPLLVLARSSPTSLPSAFLGELASEPSQGIEDVGIDAFDDVEDAGLMPGGRPEFREKSGVKVRAVRDDNSGPEAVVPEVVQESPHVVLIVGPDQGEGDGEIAERVGGQEQRAMAQVQLVGAQGAREVVEGPLAVSGHVGLTALPVEAVVEEPIGQVEEEVASHRLLHAMEAHAVIEEAVDDGVADPVGVLGSRFDPFDVRAERLAAGTGGAVFSDRHVDEGDLAQRDVANGARVGALPPSGRAALWTGEGLRRTTLTENANTSGVHACVLDGVVW